MQRRTQEKFIQIFLVIATLVMTILRFLLNEKGRVNPDSIRFQRFAHNLPIIDNTTTPLGYPLGIKFFTIFGTDEFWASKILGTFSLLFIIIFAVKKGFYKREIIATTALFSYVSIFAYTMSEAMILPFVVIFLFISRNIIIGKYEKYKSILYLSLILIILYNIRYASLFFIVAVFIFGIINYKNKFGKIFIFSSIISVLFVIIYKFTFIDHFTTNYIEQWLEINKHTTPELLIELFQGITTSFNPFIHIANPGGGIVNYGIYGIGLLNLIFLCSIFIKNGLTQTEKLFVLIGVVGIICTFGIQYFYPVTALDYRLLSPFIISIWIIYFKKIFQIFGKFTYIIPVFSLITGLTFTWLSRGNYLENRMAATKFLKEENLAGKPIKFYIKNVWDQNETKMAELISTVNPNLEITQNPKDTLKKSTITNAKILKKIKISKNRFQ